MYLNYQVPGPETKRIIFASLYRTGMKDIKDVTSKIFIQMMINMQ